MRNVTVWSLLISGEIRFGPPHNACCATDGKLIRSIVIRNRKSCFLIGFTIKVIIYLWIEFIWQKDKYVGEDNYVRGNEIWEAAYEKLIIGSLVSHVSNHVSQMIFL